MPVESADFAAALAALALADERLGDDRRRVHALLGRGSAQLQHRLANGEDVIGLLESAGQNGST